MTTSTRIKKSFASTLLLLAGILALHACSESPTVLELNRSFAVVASGFTVTGNGQTGTINTKLPSYVVVRAVNRSGLPLAGVAVTFAANTGSGSFSPASATTASDGTARTTWTLGPTVGTQRGTVNTQQGNASLALYATAKAPTTVASVSVSPASASVPVNGTVQLTGTAKDASGVTISGTSFTWASSNTAVATVSTSGLVTGKAAGSATVTATAGGKSAAATITVTTSTSTGTPSFSTIVAGVRPRGFGAGTYYLKQPTLGRFTYYVATTGNDANPGTSSAPFRTINRAAQVAYAGDVVTIRNGTYQGSVFVKNWGSATKPIVFQAENRGGVVLTGGQYSFQPASWTSGTPQTYVTLSGLVFRQYTPETASGDYSAVRAAEGWRIENCLFDRAGRQGVDIRGHRVVITRSTFQYAFMNAFSSWAPSTNPLVGIVISDLIIRNNHTNTAPLMYGSAVYVLKLSITRGALVDNIESYANTGPGFWFDHDNSGYTVRNSYFHDNVDIPNTRGTGRGMNIEINPPAGLIENNVFANNAGAGLSLTNSSGIEVRSNLFVGNSQSIAFVNVDRGAAFVLKDISVHHNQFKNWRVVGALHAYAGTFQSPTQMNIMADYNTYNPATSLTLNWWTSYGSALTLLESALLFGWERNGRVGWVAWPL